MHLGSGSKQEISINILIGKPSGYRPGHEWGAILKWIWNR